MLQKISLSVFWDKVCFKMQNDHYYISPILGQYKQWEYLYLLNRWAPGSLALALKTDSFEEAFGADKVLNWLGKKNQKAIGLDISPQILSAAKRQIGNSKLRWAATDISYMPFKNDVFDLIFSSSTYGYLDNIGEGLKEAYRILKPKGIFVISINNRCNFAAQVTRKFFLYLKKIPFPLGKAYTLNSFKVLLEEAGFRVDTYEPVVHIFPLFNSLLPFLEKKDTLLFRAISKLIMKGLKQYSRAKSPIKLFTGWYIVFKAQKSKNGSQ